MTGRVVWSFDTRKSKETQFDDDEIFETGLGALPILSVSLDRELRRVVMIVGCFDVEFPYSVCKENRLITLRTSNTSALEFDVRSGSVKLVDETTLDDLFETLPSNGVACDFVKLGPILRRRIGQWAGRACRMLDDEISMRSKREGDDLFAAELLLWEFHELLNKEK